METSGSKPNTIFLPFHHHHPKFSIFFITTCLLAVEESAKTEGNKRCKNKACGFLCPVARSPQEGTHARVQNLNANGTCLTHIWVTTRHPGRLAASPKHSCAVLAQSESNGSRGEGVRRCAREERWSFLLPRISSISQMVPSRRASRSEINKVTLPSHMPNVFILLTFCKDSPRPMFKQSDHRVSFHRHISRPSKWGGGPKCRRFFF